MKTIGLIGGISYQSTLNYYQSINQYINQQLGKQHSAKIIIVSLDFNEIFDAICTNNLDDIKHIMIDAGHCLKQSGADFIAICCNTLHKVAPDIIEAVQLPLFHILDPTAAAIQNLKIKHVALLGTQFTMQQSFHKNYLNTFGIRTILPNTRDADLVNTIIFDELCHGIIHETSRQAVSEIIHRLEQEGAEGIVLACTELPNLLPLSEVSLPIFDTTALHSRAIGALSLQVHPISSLAA